jgi:hypothetical protein
MKGTPQVHSDTLWLLVLAVGVGLSSYRLLVKCAHWVDFGQSEWFVSLIGCRFLSHVKCHKIVPPQLELPPLFTLWIVSLAQE